MEIKDIQSFASDIVSDNSERVREQKIDQTFYDDTFEVNIKNPFHVIRTGTASKIVDSLSEHIETANPQVIREPRKNSESEHKSVIKVSKLLNHWARLLAPEIDEAVKNAALRGESIFQIEYNDKYNEQDKDSLPIIVTTLDPLYVFCDPFDSFRPDRVVKEYDMDVNYLKSIYPEWHAPQRKKTSKYLAYWDKDVKYFEADKQTLSGMEEDGDFVNGTMKNIYGFTPFVHFYSGFGKRTENPETLAVGRLRKIRGRLIEECEIESRFDSVVGLYANPMRILTQTAADAATADRKELEEAYLGPGATITAPYGWQQIIYTPDLNLDQLATHLYQIRQALGMDLPPIMSGVASGSRTSGRLEDISYEHIQKKWSRLITNLETALSIILGMGLRILDTIPEALPITVRATSIKDGETINEEYKITKEDIDGYYECKVKLNPEEAVEADRKVMLYDRLADKKRVSWKRFLVEGMGKTEDEAEDIMAEAIAETAIFNNEMMTNIVVQEAMSQQGMTKQLEVLKTQTEQQKQIQNVGLKSRSSEISNPTSTAIIRQALGESPNQVRNPPNQTAPNIQEIQQ